jgi:glutathione synthase
VRARACALEISDVTGERESWWSLGAEIDEPLAAFDAVLMRKDPPFDMEYVASTWLLEQAVREGARVFNDPRAVRNHNEKLAILEFPQFTAPTIVTRSAQDLRAFVTEHREAVFKLLDGMGGMSVFRARADDPNLSVIIETMNRFGERTVMAQRFIPAISEGDKRVLLIDGEVVPYCLARIPQAGEFRGNLAAGGRGVARALSERDREIAQALGPTLAARGLLLVGLDVIGENLTEINVTSPTCFREITAQSGCDVAALFIDALERRVGAGPHTSA